MGVTTRSAARRDSLVQTAVPTLQPTISNGSVPAATGNTPPTPTTANAHWHEFRRMVGPSIRAEFEARGENLTPKKMRRAISLRWAQMKSHMEAKQASVAALSTTSTEPLPPKVSSHRTDADGDYIPEDVSDAFSCANSAQASLSYPPSTRPLDNNTVPNGAAAFSTSNFDYAPLGYTQDDAWIPEFEALMASLPADWMEQVNWAGLDLPDPTIPTAEAQSAPLYDSNYPVITSNEWLNWNDANDDASFEYGESDQEMSGVTQEFLDIIMGVI